MHTPSLQAPKELSVACEHSRSHHSLAWLPRLCNIAMVCQPSPSWAVCQQREHSLSPTSCYWRLTQPKPESLPFGAPPTPISWLISSPQHQIIQLLGLIPLTCNRHISHVKPSVFSTGLCCSKSTALTSSDTIPTVWIYKEKPPGMRQSQLLWATCSRASPPSERRISSQPLT